METSPAVVSWLLYPWQLQQCLAGVDAQERRLNERTTKERIIQVLSLRRLSEQFALRGLWKDAPSDGVLHSHHTNRETELL